MKIENTEIKGCYIIKGKRFGDERGWFMETYSEERMKMFGIPTTYVQDNLSMSIKENVFRGMHFQRDEAVQGKLVSCIEGKVLDYIYDARIGSPTFGKSVIVELDGNTMEPNQAYVPEGCLHGFYVVKGPAYFMYKVTSGYNAEKDGSILCTDPELKLELPSEDFILSDKDKNAPLYKDGNLNFKYSPRCLITGINGQLGHDIALELKERGIKDILGTDIDTMDITNISEVEEVISMFQPDIIFHCAAWTAVDKAEIEKEACELVNVKGTKNIVEIAKKVNAKLFYISTDYVFDGTKEGLYEVTDKPNPQSVYGLTKYQGEEEVKTWKKSFIVRTSWVFGKNGGNFIKTMLNQYGKRDEVTVVNDQFGSPTYTIDLAKTLVDMSETEKYGTYHVNNEGFCSWAEFAEEIFKIAGYDIKVKPVTTKEYYAGKDMNEIATRPANSRLNKKALKENGFDLLPTWQEATKNFINILKGENK